MENKDINMRTYGYVEENTYTDTYEGKYAPVAETTEPEIGFMKMFRHECGNTTSMGLESRNYIGADTAIATNGEGTENATEWYNQF